MIAAIILPGGSLALLGEIQSNRRPTVAGRSRSRR